MPQNTKSSFIQSVDQLAKKIPLSKQEQDLISTITQRHPMCIPQYYLNLIDSNDPDDPIRRIAIPSYEEMSETGDYDTSGEESNTILPGVQHKYDATALVLSTNQCFMYCRFCFRKRFVGYSQAEINQRMQEALAYIQSHPSINNVLITGGDSFTLPTSTIENYIEGLSKIEHLDFIRFGTRVPVVYPMRIHEDEGLLQVLKKANRHKQVVIVTHYNHPREITEESKKAIRCLQEAGCVIKNQTVLLRGVNDQPATLVALNRGLSAIGIQPYYVFQCRPVKHVVGYQVPLEEGLAIIQETKKQLNGLSKAFRYIMSHPKGKIEIVGKLDKEVFFKFHQAKNSDDHERVFFHTISSKTTWLDENLQPYQE